MKSIELKATDRVEFINHENKSLSLIIKNSRHKLGDILDNLPYGIIDKTSTGIGATTLEINSKRNSIIVVPLKIIAASKVQQHPENCYYAGSPINDLEGFKKENFVDFLKNESIKFKKIIVVAESLKKVIETIGEIVYNTYFLMIDEIDCIQESSTFRNSIENCLDFYLKFPINKRALVSATMISFSNPALKSEERIKIQYQNEIKRDVESLITSFNPLGSCIEHILSIKTDEQKIVIAYNSVNGSRQIANKLIELEPNLKGNIKILCSANSKERAGEYYSELLNDYYPAQINFITAAYFSGYDINEKYHLISLLDRQYLTTKLSFNTLKQISGRGRIGLYSETIICNCIFNSFMDEKILLDRLISAAKSEIQALECIKKHLQEYDFLKGTLDNIRNAVVEKGTFLGYRLVRTGINRTYQISYFNIDAFLEKQNVMMYEQSDVATFIDKLEKSTNLQSIKQFADSKVIVKILKDKTDNNKANHIEEAAQKLKHITDFEFGNLLRSPAPDEQMKFFLKYEKLDKYFHDKNILIDKLKDISKFNKVKFENLMIAVAHKSLPKKHPFRIHLEGEFVLNKIFKQDEVLEILERVYAYANIPTKFGSQNKAITRLKNLVIIKKIRNLKDGNGFKVTSFDKMDFEDGDGFLLNVAVRNENNPFMPV